MPSPAFSAGYFQLIKTKENAVISCLFYPSLVLSVRYRLFTAKKVKEWRQQGRYKKSARCIRANYVIMSSISIISLCLCICRIARELNLSSVMLLRNGVCSLFIPLKLRSAVHVDTAGISQQSYESYILLRDRIGVGLVKNLNHGLWLHIRIHFTQ